MGRRPGRWRHVDRDIGSAEPGLPTNDPSIRPEDRLEEPTGGPFPRRLESRLVGRWANVDSRTDGSDVRGWDARDVPGLILGPVGPPGAPDRRRHTPHKV